jgi:hypothetical protein
MYVSVGRYKCFAPVGSNACGVVGAHAAQLDEFVTNEVLTFLSAVKLRPIPNAIDTDALRQSVEAATDRLRDWDRRHAVLGEIDRAEWQPIHDELLTVIEAGREVLAVAEKQTTSTLRPGKRADLDAWWTNADIDAKRQALAHTVERIEVAKVGSIRNRFDPRRVQIIWNWEAYGRAGYPEPDLKVDAKKYAEQYGVTEDLIEAVTSADNARLRRTMQSAPARAVAAAAKADEELTPLEAELLAEATKTGGRKNTSAKH